MRLKLSISTEATTGFHLVAECYVHSGKLKNLGQRSLSKQIDGCQALDKVFAMCQLVPRQKNTRDGEVTVMACLPSVVMTRHSTNLPAQLWFAECQANDTWQTQHFFECQVKGIRQNNSKQGTKCLVAECHGKNTRQRPIVCQLFLP